MSQNFKIPYHVHKRYIQKHSSCKGVDPLDNLSGAAKNSSNDHADVTCTGRKEIGDDGLLVRQTRVQQDGKIT